MRCHMFTGHTGLFAIQIVGLPIIWKGKCCPNINSDLLGIFARTQELLQKPLMRSEFTVGARRRSSFSSWNYVLLRLMKMNWLIIGKPAWSWRKSMCPYLTPLINWTALIALQPESSLLRGRNVSFVTAAALMSAELLLQKRSESHWAPL